MRLDLMRHLLEGLSVGECLGATSEFMSRDSVLQTLQQAKFSRSRWPLRPMGGGAFGWRAGEATDDGDMALALLGSFLHNNGRFVPSDFLRRLVEWLDSCPRDVGNTTRRVLRMAKPGEGWMDAAYAVYTEKRNNAPNGSLCRNGVVAGMAQSLDEAFTISVLQSAATHFSPMCALVCCVQTWLLWEMIEEERWPFETHEDWVQAWHADFVSWIEGTNNLYVKQWLSRVEEANQMTDDTELLTKTLQDIEDFDPYAKGAIKGSEGGALVTLQVAIWALQWSRSSVACPAPRALVEHVGDLFAGRPEGEDHGARVLAWVALVGADADSYGAAGGPLVAAANQCEYPERMAEGLEAVAVFDAMVKDLQPRR